MKKPIIIFEGVDKSGKTTLLNRFNKLTNFKYIVLDRFTISSKVYDCLFERNNRQYFKEIENKFFDVFNVIIVYCYCDEDIIKQRLKEANEELPDRLKNIRMVEKQFRYELIAKRAINNCYIIEVDTSNDLEICLEKILNEVDAYGYSGYNSF